MKLKSRHKFFLVFILIFIFAGLDGQIRTGRIFGLNISALTLKTMGKSYDPKSAMGIHFGGFFEIPVRRDFGFQTRILFSAKGSDYETDTGRFFAVAYLS